MAKTLREYARMGASIRLQQLAEETQAILKAFPGLRREAPGAPKHGRRKLTEAEKKVISVRMKAAWARRKKAIKPGVVATRGRDSL